MKQSRLMSLVESVANVIVGYGVAVVTQILIFPLFGLNTTLAQNLKMGAVFTVVSIVRSFVNTTLAQNVRIGAVFTVVSIVRSFALRRLFEAIRTKKSPTPENSG